MSKGTAKRSAEHRRTPADGLLEAHSPGQERPLGGYALLTGTFGSLAGLFALWMSRSGRSLPERMALADMVLIALATHKLARLLAKDRVTSAVRAPFTRFEGDAGPGEVDESARGHGLRLALGELLTCPFCLGLWIAAAFSAGLAVAPRPTRWVASVFAVELGSDMLQIAYKKIEDTL